jgi:hypothetical protein
MILDRLRLLDTVACIRASHSASTGPEAIDSSGVDPPPPADAGGVVSSAGVHGPRLEPHAVLASHAKLCCAVSSCARSIAAKSGGVRVTETDAPPPADAGDGASTSTPIGSKSASLRRGERFGGSACQSKSARGASSDAALPNGGVDSSRPSTTTSDARGNVRLLMIRSAPLLPAPRPGAHVERPSAWKGRARSFFVSALGKERSALRGGPIIKS